VRERFAAVPTAALVDVLDGHGLREQALPPTIRALVAGSRLAGQAFTVEGRPSEHGDWDAAIRKTLAMLGAVPSGHVAVYQCHHDRSAHFGELSATSLQSRGVAGCVIDGGCRDVRLIEAIGFPVFARFVTPEDSTWRWEVTATQVPIAIGTVRVEPGDWVVGDEDGVVVVPTAVAEDVLTAAEARVGTENLVRDAVRDGMTPLEAYERYGTF
jgi:4-hydroxy-4-methyl-2-oxoglutarate aldolase